MFEILLEKILINETMTIFLKILFWTILLLIIFFSSSSFFAINRANMYNLSKKVSFYVVCALTILIATAPMSWNPEWNGVNPAWHHAQYEHMAESLLSGKLYLDDYPVDPRLAELPAEILYEPSERDSLGLDYQFDEAFYNGKYYMYFGIVPVIILFLPYLAITDSSLPTFHATQIFIAFFILGLFVLFRELWKKYFPEMRFAVHLLLSATFSLLSSYFCIAEPALYCTATASALCFEIWSLYLFYKAVYICNELNSQIQYAFFASLLGALTFGCRPSIGVINLLVIPMLIYFVSNHKKNAAFFCKIVLAASPYIVVGVLLMAYNYMRFGSPMEFGVTYLLTDVNLYAYKYDSSKILPANVLNKLSAYLFAKASISSDFPWINYNGAFISFPIFCSIILIPLPVVYKKLRSEKILHFVLSTIAVAIIIAIFDSVFTIEIWEQYRLDFYFLLCIATFFVIGCIAAKYSNWITNVIICLICEFTFYVTLLLYLVPRNMHLAVCFPDVLTVMEKIMKIR